MKTLFKSTKIFLFTNLNNQAININQLFQIQKNNINQILYSMIQSNYFKEKKFTSYYFILNNFLYKLFF